MKCKSCPFKIEKFTTICSHYKKKCSKLARRFHDSVRQTFPIDPRLIYAGLFFIFVYMLAGRGTRPTITVQSRPQAAVVNTPSFVNNNGVPAGNLNIGNPIIPSVPSTRNTASTTGTTTGTTANTFTSPTQTTLNARSYNQASGGAGIGSTATTRQSCPDCIQECLNVNQCNLTKCRGDCHDRGICMQRTLV
jgi:hypothetical protein